MPKNCVRGHRSLVLVALGVAGACGGTKATITETKPGDYAGQSGWTFLPTASDDPAGSSKGGGGNSGGGGGASGHAGVSGTAGSGGVGGSVALPPITFKCGGKRPDQPLITRFDGFDADRWQSPGNLDGGVYVYPDGLKPTAGEFLRFADQVKTWSGMGVWFSGCIDASQYLGFRFTISGDAGPTGQLQVFVISNRDKYVDTQNRVGACVPDDPDNSWLNCRPPALTLPVTSEPVTQSILWSAFKGGLPSDKTDGSDVLALEWAFQWDSGDGPYAAQLTVDNVEFLVNEAPTGVGGAGGAPDTSEGGAPGSPDMNGQGGN